MWPYLLGVVTTPLVAVAVLFLRELPSALKQAAYEREAAIPRQRSCLRGWAWWLFVAGRQTRRDDRTA
jgi:hypothetical protein